MSLNRAQRAVGIVMCTILGGVLWFPAWRASVEDGIVLEIGIGPGEEPGTAMQETELGVLRVNVPVAGHQFRWFLFSRPPNAWYTIEASDNPDEAHELRVGVIEGPQLGQMAIEAIAVVVPFGLVILFLGRRSWGASDQEC